MNTNHSDWIVPYYTLDSKETPIRIPLKQLAHQTKLLLCDADGVLRFCTIPDQPCPNKPDEQTINPVMVSFLKEITPVNINRLALAIVSNQGGVELGLIERNMAYRMLMDTGQEVLRLAGVENKKFSTRICPFASKDHPMRKPNPGMLNAAIYEVPGRLDPGRDVVMIGDMESDRDAAFNAGCRFVWIQELTATMPDSLKDPSEIKL